MNLTEQFAHMATGAMYDDLTPELIAARVEAVQAIDVYNRSYGRPAEEREALLRRIVGSMGREVNLEPTFRCEFGRNIHLGSHFFANFDCVMLDGAPITIGDNVLLGPKVGLYTSNHALDPRERADGELVRSRSATTSGSVATSRSSPAWPLARVVWSEEAALLPAASHPVSSLRATRLG